MASGEVQAWPPMAQHFDLIVIRSGPAGRRAVRATKLKQSVLVVERGRRGGGVCVHTGTIPSKTLFRERREGWRPRPDVSSLRRLVRCVRRAYDALDVAIREVRT